MEALSRENFYYYQPPPPPKKTYYIPTDYLGTIYKKLYISISMKIFQHYHTVKFLLNESLGGTAFLKSKSRFHSVGLRKIT
jgi:hypothetical protein